MDGEATLGLRRERGAACTWLAKTLSMGSSSAVRSLLCRAMLPHNHHSAARPHRVGPTNRRRLVGVGQGVPRHPPSGRASTAEIRLTKGFTS